MIHVGISGARPPINRVKKNPEYIEYQTLAAHVDVVIASLAAKAITIGHGTAAGIDTKANQSAEQHDVDVKLFPPDFEKHGSPQALFVRNQEIIDWCDELHAFPASYSSGTIHAINAMAKKNVEKLYIYIVDPNEGGILNFKGERALWALRKAGHKV